MKKKLLLIVPPYTYLKKPSAQASLGILYVSSYIKKYLGEHFSEICLEDCSEKTVKESGYTLSQKAEDYDVFGITMTTMDYKNVKDILQAMVYSKKPYIVVGGTHPTVAYSETIKRHDSYLFDRMFVGDIEGTNYPIETNDIPDRGIIKNGGITNYGIFCENDDNARSFSIMISRGCHYKCAFCVSGNRRNYAQFRSPESVEKEIAYILGIGEANQVRIQDDNLFVHPNFDEVVKVFGKYNLKWRASARINNINENKLRLAVENGCKEIGVGIESADQGVLDIMDKKIQVNLYKGMLKRVKDVGIKLRLFLMINTPKESIWTPELNIKYLEEVQPNYVTLTIFNPFPGTPIYLNPHKYGIYDMVKNFEDYCISFDENDLHNDKIYAKYYNISDSQQISNRNKMIDYLVEKGWANLG